MSLKLEMERKYQQQLVESVVAETLRQLGLSDGYLCTNECRRRFGTWFTDHVKSGDLRAVKQGNRNMYSVIEINALRAAEIRLAARRASISEPQII